MYLSICTASMTSKTNSSVDTQSVDESLFVHLSMRLILIFHCWYFVMRKDHPKWDGGENRLTKIAPNHRRHFIHCMVLDLMRHTVSFSWHRARPNVVTSDSQLPQQELHNVMNTHSFCFIYLGILLYLQRFLTKDPIGRAWKCSRSSNSSTCGALHMYTIYCLCVFACARFAQCIAINSYKREKLMPLLMLDCACPIQISQPIIHRS